MEIGKQISVSSIGRKPICNYIERSRVFCTGVRLKGIVEERKNDEIEV